MFENLTDRLTVALRMISSKGRLTESDVDIALREVRLALLEADVNFRVARDFVNRIRDKAIGENILQGISPGQQVIKIVNDELVSLLGTHNYGLSKDGSLPKAILMVGLQGSGKTTTSAKLALHLRKDGQKALLVAADLRRPAAMDQLEMLGKQLDISVFRENLKPEQTIEVVHRSLSHAKKIGAAWVIIDTGGRLHADDALMAELKELKSTADPVETLLVVDAMAGQDAVNAAEGFNLKIGLTGIVLSKLDGDARGGAALTVTSITGVPIKFAGVGEKMDALELFHPERIASRILGMGDVLTLVERVSAQVTEEQAKELERKVRKATFDLDDFQGQLKQLQRMGSIGSIMEMVPGLRAMGSKLPISDINDDSIKKIDSIISSMTNWEKHHPDQITGGRRKRIANGSGHTPADVNRLLNQFKQMQKLMRQFSSGKKKGFAGLGIPGF